MLALIALTAKLREVHVAVWHEACLVNALVKTVTRGEQISATGEAVIMGRCVPPSRQTYLEAALAVLAELCGHLQPTQQLPPAVCAAAAWTVPHRSSYAGRAPCSRYAH